MQARGVTVGRITPACWSPRPVALTPFGAKVLRTAAAGWHESGSGYRCCPGLGLFTKEVPLLLGQAGNPADGSKCGPTGSRTRASPIKSRVYGLTNTLGPEKIAAVGIEPTVEWL